MANGTEARTIFLDPESRFVGTLEKVKRSDAVATLAVAAQIARQGGLIPSSSPAQPAFETRNLKLETQKNRRDQLRSRLSRGGWVNLFV